MRWDAKMMRKLAVPIALRNVGSLDTNVITRTRILKPSKDDPEEYHILAGLAENRARIERLHREIDHVVQEVDCSGIANELEYLKTDIELSLIEVSAEIEDMPSAEDVLSQEAETIFA
jgi:hypothetical protein